MCIRDRNLIVRRFARFEGEVVTYIHGGGTHGVMVLFDTDVAGKEGFAAYGKDVAMQIAAANPTYVSKDEVPSDEIEKEKEIPVSYTHLDVYKRQMQPT